MNAPQQLHEASPSVWLDNIRKDLLTTGTLVRSIGEYAVTGVTSNPTVLEAGQEPVSSQDSFTSALIRRYRQARGRR